MASRYVEQPPRSFGEALKDRRNLRAWRRSLGLCPECNDMTRADACKRHGKGEVIDLEDERMLRAFEKAIEERIAALSPEDSDA